MKDGRTVGILPLGRTTFDVPFAEEKLRLALLALEGSGYRLAGARGLLFDAKAARAAIAELQAAGIDQVLVLQATFTDASMIVEISRAFPQPLSIWAFPEPRTGGRLRLNAFCGLNLAAHALGLGHRTFGYLYADPASTGIAAEIGDLLGGKRLAAPVAALAARSGDPAGASAAAALRGARIGRIGAHPEGFDTCRYDRQKLDALFGISVDELELPSLFDTARMVGAPAAGALRSEAAAMLAGLDQVDQGQLDRSLRLKSALESIRGSGRYDAFAIRCWPETFTEYGGA
ncbi:MAG: hypothetical protein K0S21_3331, partial [Rhizobiaceae bacterium]|nr:hypothetical protein [Rhizobiaceae bacterium]